MIEREVGSETREAVDGPVSEVCVVCGSLDVRAIKCKLICHNCGTILRTCSD